MQGRAAKDQHGEHHQLGATVGDDGAADGRGNRVIDDLHRIHLAEAAKVFANPVKNNHRLVNRVAQHRQNGSEHRQGKLPLKKREKPQNNDHVMQVGDDGGHCKLPLKAHRKVKHDAQHHKSQCFEAVGRQLVAHLRTDKLGAAQGGRGIGGLQSGQHFFTLLAGRAAFLSGHADEHILGSAKVLHLHVFDAQGVYGAADGGHVGAVGVGHFHQRAAGKFHRQMQAAREQKEDGS